MNNIITQAIAKTNEDRTLAAIRNAQTLISNIESEQKSLALYGTQIEEDRKALKGILDSQLTYEKVAGKPESATPSLTEATISKAINEIVKARQDCVANKAKSLSDAIANKIDAQTAINKRIADYREQLEKVTADTLEVKTIVG